MQKTSNNKNTSNLCHINTNQSANNPDNDSSDPGQSKKQHELKKYQDYLISLFNPHHTLNPFTQHNFPRLNLIRKFALMNYPAFLKFNPLKFTKIIQLPYTIFDSHFKQITNIIKSKTRNEQPKRDPIPGTSSEIPHALDPHSDEAIEHQELEVEEVYYDCVEFITEANLFNSQVAKSKKKRTLEHAEVVRRLGEYAIVYIDCYVEVSSSSYVSLTSLSLLSLPQPYYSSMDIVSVAILFRMCTSKSINTRLRYKRKFALLQNCSHCSDSSSSSP